MSYRILLSEENVISRGRAIQSLLRPISVNKSGPQPGTRTGLGYIRLGYYDGQSPKDSDVRSWKFACHGGKLLCQYLEHWQQASVSAGDAEWYLSQAYLHLYLKSSGQEILAWHCDPNIPKGADHYEFKRGPHYHVIDSASISKHSHLSMYLGYVDRVLASAEELTQALSEAVKMIRKQIIDAHK